MKLPPGFLLGVAASVAASAAFVLIAKLFFSPDIFIAPDLRMSRSPKNQTPYLVFDVINKSNRRAENVKFSLHKLRTVLTSDCREKTYSSKIDLVTDEVMVLEPYDLAGRRDDHIFALRTAYSDAEEVVSLLESGLNVRLRLRVQATDSVVDQRRIFAHSFDEVALRRAGLISREPPQSIEQALENCRRFLRSRPSK